MKEEDALGIWWGLVIAGLILISFYAGRTAEYLSELNEARKCQVELKGYSVAHYEAEKAIEELNLKIE